ncbi:MAG: hypothetical protein E4H21_03205 [Thermodesulfobacteriales bacterium]|nr:MAG: hypothetical protein E4H21_03205 [Thermodesulfobacteriales bacterium]
MAVKKPSNPTARRPSKPKEESKHKVVLHLDEIRKDVMALKTRIGKTKQSDLTKLSADVAKKVSDSASEIMKSSTDVLHKATKVLQFVVLGAVEGGKKALKEDKKPRRKATPKPATKTTPRATTGTSRKTTKKAKT